MSKQIEKNNNFFPRSSKESFDLSAQHYKAALSHLSSIPSNIILGGVSLIHGTAIIVGIGTGAFGIMLAASNKVSSALKIASGCAEAKKWLPVLAATPIDLAGKGLVAGLNVAVDYRACVVPGAVVKHCLTHWRDVFVTMPSSIANGLKDLCFGAAHITGGIKDLSLVIAYSAGGYSLLPFDKISNYLNNKEWEQLQLTNNSSEINNSEAGKKREKHSFVEVEWHPEILDSLEDLHNEAFELRYNLMELKSNIEGWENNNSMFGVSRSLAIRESLNQQMKQLEENLLKIYEKIEYAERVKELPQGWFKLEDSPADIEKILSIKEIDELLSDFEIVHCNDINEEDSLYCSNDINIYSQLALEESEDLVQGWEMIQATSILENLEEANLIGQINNIDIS